jgi:hypothetical protein
MKFFAITLSIMFAHSCYASDCLEVFSADAILERVANGKSIQFPFKLSYLVDGEFEFETKTEVLNVDSVSRIIGVSTGSLNSSISAGSKRTINYISENERTMTYVGPDSGWHITWHFVFKSGSWMLSGITDTST